MGSELATKDLRDGRYVLMAPLGQGSQGTTWDAVDKREGRPVAVKAFDVRGAREWKDVELAEREARVLSELRHPLLPRYIEHFEDAGVLYLVMEKVHGTPLSVLQKQGPRMSEKDVMRFLHDADQALVYLHGRTPPVIHRDLKPSNVIRRTDGSYAFVDFGAVREHLRSEGGSTVVGTFGYMAPEQFQGRAGPASDVYSIGATAIAMITGVEPEKLPHRGLSIDVAAAVDKMVSPRIRDALVQMLEPDPDKRATRIGALLDRVSSRAPDPPPRSSDSRRHPPRDVRNDASQALRDAMSSAGGGKRARREARRAAKRARRDARWAGRHDGRAHRLPLGIRILFNVGLVIAQLAVTIALQLVVPFVLTLLSVLFGTGLRRAARSVSEAGGHAADVLARTRVDGEEEAELLRAPAPEPRAPAAGVRVVVPDARTPEDDAEAELEAEEESEGRSDGKRGRMRR